MNLPDQKNLVISYFRHVLSLDVQIRKYNNVNKLKIEITKTKEKRFGNTLIFCYVRFGSFSQGNSQRIDAVTDKKY